MPEVRNNALSASRLSLGTDLKWAAYAPLQRQSVVLRCEECGQALTSHVHHLNTCQRKATYHFRIVATSRLRSRSTLPATDLSCVTRVPEAQAASTSCSFLTPRVDFAVRYADAHLAKDSSGKPECQCIVAGSGSAAGWLVLAPKPCFMRDVQLVLVAAACCVRSSLTVAVFLASVTLALGAWASPSANWSLGLLR